MEEVFFWNNLENNPNKTVMYGKHQSAPRWKDILKIFEDKCSDYKKKRYNVYVYRSFPYPPSYKSKKDLR